MPFNNCFQHQLYPTAPAKTPVLKKLECVDAEAGAYNALHTRCQIGRVILVHGTFVGNDPVGLSETIASLGKGIPVIGRHTDQIAVALQRYTQSLTDSLVKDIGTYCPEFRDAFQQLVGNDPQVELLKPAWSSQNHHLARADLAMQLLHQLLQRPLPSPQKVLLWGHSHAGNAFAMLTNLLANDPDSVNRFFEAAGDQPGEHWRAVRKALQNAPTPHPLAERIAIVTFGTPVRYGWDLAGCSSLLHVTFHRPHNPDRAFTTMPAMPPASLNNILSASCGDWVQSFAIAGTDLSSVLSMTKNQKLTDLLQENLPGPTFEISMIPSQVLRDTYVRWQYGTRCHEDGLNLLVDYEPSGDRTPLGQSLENTLFGHGVATTLRWLPAHLQLVTETLSAGSAEDR